MKDNYCPDCADNDELVVMEKHEWPVEAEGERGKK
jgi:hypothetical protein